MAAAIFYWGYFFNNLFQTFLRSHFSNEPLKYRLYKLNKRYVSNIIGWPPGPVSRKGGRGFPRVNILPRIFDPWGGPGGGRDESFALFMRDFFTLVCTKLHESKTKSVSTVGTCDNMKTRTTDRVLR